MCYKTGPFYLLLTCGGFGGDDGYAVVRHMGAPHGHGTYYGDNCTWTYEGEWRNGKPHGHGIYIDDNYTYEGQWIAGEPFVRD